MYICAFLVDAKINVVIPAIWVENFDAELCFNHGINRNKIYKIFFSRQYKLPDFGAPIQTAFSNVEDGTYRAKLCGMKFSKDAAQQKAAKRRRVEPFTCTDFPIQENRQTEPFKLVSERALLTPIATTPQTVHVQVKTEMDLVQLQDQVGNLLRQIPVIDMDSILEEVFTIDVDDVDHEFDERFASHFGLSQLKYDCVKQEPQTDDQEEPISDNCQPSVITPSPPVGVACSSATAIAIAQRTDSPPLPRNSPQMDLAAQFDNGTENEWFFDLVDQNEMGGFLYDDSFAQKFGFLLSESYEQIKQETDEESFDPSNKTENSLDSSTRAEIPSSSSATIAHDNQAHPSEPQPSKAQPIQDPISRHYLFDVDILGNRHYPLWNITIPFSVVKTLLSYNTDHQDVFHDRLFVQVLVLGSLNASGGRPQNIIQAAQSLLSLRVNADVDRMGRFSRHMESLRKILESRVSKK